MKQKESKSIAVASAYPDHYEIYEDGSMKAWCKRCNNPEEVDAERAAKIQKIPEWSSSFTCTPCWKKSKEPEKQDTQDRIAYAPAANLAMERISSLEQRTDVATDEQFKVEFEKWHSFFYDFLRGNPR